MVVPVHLCLAPCTHHQPDEDPRCQHHQQTDTSPLHPGTTEDFILSGWSPSIESASHTVPCTRNVPWAHTVPCAHTSPCHLGGISDPEPLSTPRNSKMSQRCASRAGSAAPCYSTLSLKEGQAEGARVPSCHTSQVTSADPVEKQLSSALHAVMQVFTPPLRF